MSRVLYWASKGAVNGGLVRSNPRIGVYPACEETDRLGVERSRCRDTTGMRIPTVKVTPQSIILSRQAKIPQQIGSDPALAALVIMTVATIDVTPFHSQRIPQAFPTTEPPSHQAMLKRS